MYIYFEKKLFSVPITDKSKILSINMILSNLYKQIALKRLKCIKKTKLEYIDIL